jgi:Rad3-related DNA helicase
LIEFSKITPDGLLCFFPSYLYLETITSTWASTVRPAINGANCRVFWMRFGNIS